MQGPVYLHWDGSYKKYHAFFAHLRCKLDNINISGLEFGAGNLIVGSDEELWRKQWKLVFHSNYTLCCRHLQENVRWWLQDGWRFSGSAVGHCQACLWCWGTCRRALPDDSWRFRTPPHTFQYDRLGMSLTRCVPKLCLMHVQLASQLPRRTQSLHAVSTATSFFVWKLSATKLQGIRWPNCPCKNDRWGRPLLPDILGQSDRFGANLRFSIYFRFDTVGWIIWPVKTRLQYDL